MGDNVQCPRCGEDLTDHCWDKYACTNCGQNLTNVIALIYPLATALSRANAAMEMAITHVLTKRKSRTKTWEERLINYLGAEATKTGTVLKQFGDALDDVPPQGTSPV